LKFRSVVPHTRHRNFNVKAALESKIATRCGAAGTSTVKSPGWALF
jgi:hypothetical protein